MVYIANIVKTGAWAAPLLIKKVSCSFQSR